MECHWNQTQRDRLSLLLSEGKTTIAFWNSDQFGFAVNGGNNNGYVPVCPGMFQEIPGPLELCGPRALHATLDPLKWKGSRVWIVALHGETSRDSDKLGALKREILGEVLPHECFDPRMGARLGRKDLSGANLSGANLYGANLYGANLSGADLSRAHLYGADLYVADLSRADLSGANLYWANLYGADLSRADLSGANLYGANLSRANLSLALNLDKAIGYVAPAKNKE